MTPEVLTAVAGFFAAILASWVTPSIRERGKNRRAQNTELTKGDANLRDDQREFIATLQQENKAWRAEIEAMRKTVSELRQEVDNLRGELAAERRKREASEARTGAENTTRARLNNADEETERQVSAAGDTAEQQSRRDNPEPS